MNDGWIHQTKVGKYANKVMEFTEKINQLMKKLIGRNYFSTVSMVNEFFKPFIEQTMPHTY